MAKEKVSYAPKWRDRAMALIIELNHFYWFMSDTGRLQNDPDPDEEFSDPDYDYEDLLVFAYNRHLEACGEKPNDLGKSFWYIPADFGFSTEELRVLFYTAGADADEFARSQAECLGKKTMKKYWSPWLREKLEESLLLD